jgi:hypothetical protein
MENFEYDVDIPGLGKTVVVSPTELTSREAYARGLNQLMPKVGKDTPELSQAGLSFGNSLKAASAYLSTSDPKALQDIVVKNIEGAQPGIDNDGNPYVVIQGKPFYLNRPGLSGADAAGFVGDLIKFAPVAKFSNMAKSGLTRILTATGGSGLVSAGSELGAQVLGSDQGFDVAKVGLDAAFGGAGQFVGDALSRFVAARRPIMDGAGRYTAEFQQALKSAGINIQDFGDAGRQAIISAYKNLGTGFARQAQDVTTGARQAEAQAFGIPLTRGQAAGDVPQLAREEAMRQGGRGAMAQRTMSQFDVQQSQAVKDAINQRLGNVFAPRIGLFNDQQAAGGGLYEMVRDRAKQMKGAATDLYKQLDLPSVRVDAQNVGNLPGRVRAKIQESDFILGEGLTPKTNQIITQLETIVPSAGAVEITDVSLKQIEKVRRQISNIAKDAAPGSSDAQAARLVMQEFDSWLDDGIQAGLVKGDPDQLDLLKRARSLYKNYKQSFGAGKPMSPDADAQNAIRKIVSKDLTPTDTMNIVFGASKLGDNQTSARIVGKLKTLFGEGSLEFENIRSAAFSRLFQDSIGNIKPTSTIVREIDELTMGKGSAVAKELFTSKQVKQLRDFRSAIAKTITPAEAKNPSKTGYEIARLGGDVARTLGLTGAAQTAATGDLGLASIMAAASLGGRTGLGMREAARATSPMAAPRPSAGFALPLGVGFGGLLTPEEEFPR